MKKYILLFTVLFASSAFAQENYLAGVGDNKITEEEFIHRYEMSIQFNKHWKTMREGLKKEFLKTLTAEKIFAAEALELQLDTLDSFKQMFHYIEKMFARDLLYTIEVKEKSKQRADELLNDFLTNNTIIYVDYLSSSNQKEIEKIYYLLNGGVDFDLISSEINKGTDSLFFGDPLFLQLIHLQDDDISEIYERNDNYFIYRVKEIKTNIGDADLPLENKFKQLEKGAKEQAEEEYYLLFMQQFFKDKTIKADGNIMRQIAENISHLALEKSSRISKDDPAVFDPDDYQIIKNIFADDLLEMEYIDLPGDAGKVKNFIYFLLHENLILSDHKVNAIAAHLNAKTKKYIEQELLAVEAINRNYHNAPAVKKNLKMWKEYLLSSAYQNHLMKNISVTDSEVEDYFNQRNYNKKVLLADIEEILIDDLDQVEVILNEFSSGASFNELSIKYSKRIWNESDGPAPGIYSVSLEGEIGEIIRGMEPEDIYGPFQVNSGYSIIRLINREEKDFEHDKEFPVLKEKLRRDLTFNKIRRSLIERTSRLAVKYSVEIDFEKLKEVYVTDLNAMVYRQFGFGGKLTAVPLYIPFEDWYDEWQKLLILNP
jgi:hypothetical protein